MEIVVSSVTQTDLYGFFFPAQVPLCRPSESPCLLKMSWEIVKCAGWYQALGTPARIPDVDDEARLRRNSVNSSQNQIGYI